MRFFSRLRNTAASAVIALALAGCGSADDEVALSSGPADETTALNGADATGGWSDVVNLQLRLRRGGSRRCAGLVLSEHWLLTAAHCVQDVVAQAGTFHEDALTVTFTDRDGRPQASYSWNNVSIYRHPQYKIGSADYDIALLRLYHDGLERLHKAKIYTDDGDPSRFGRFVFVGYAPGTRHPVKNRGTFAFTGQDTRTVSGRSSRYGVCDSDIGATYELEVDGLNLALALQGGMQPAARPNSCARPGEVVGTRIRDKMKWITDTAALKKLPLACAVKRTRSGVSYRECREVPPEPEGHPNVPGRPSQPGQPPICP